MRLGSTRLKILAMVIDGAKCGRPPSIREMMRKLDFHSPNGVRQHLLALQRAGLIDWETTHARTIMPRCRFIPVDQLGAVP